MNIADPNTPDENYKRKIESLLTRLERISREVYLLKQVKDPHYINVKHRYRAAEVSINEARTSIKAGFDLFINLAEYYGKENKGNAPNS